MNNGKIFTLSPSLLCLFYLFYLSARSHSCLLLCVLFHYMFCTGRNQTHSRVAYLPTLPLESIVAPATLAALADQVKRLDPFTTPPLLLMGL